MPGFNVVPIISPPECGRKRAPRLPLACILSDPSLLKDIKKLAIDLEVSASVLIEAAIREFMERQNKKNVSR